MSMTCEMHCIWSALFEKMCLSYKIYILCFTKMKFIIKDFFSKCEEIRRKLRIWSHLLKTSLTENFIFCTVLIELMLGRCLEFPVSYEVNKALPTRLNERLKKLFFVSSFTFTSKACLLSLLTVSYFIIIYNLSRRYLTCLESAINLSIFWVVCF